MSADLKECPHCGSQAQLDDCRTIWRVICTSATCGALVLGDRAPEPEDGDEYPAGYWEAFEKSAIDRWNARPAIAPPVAAGSVDRSKIDDLLVKLSIAAADVARGGHPDIHRAASLEIINAIDTWGGQRWLAGALHGGASTQAMIDSYGRLIREAEKSADMFAERAEKAEARVKELEEEISDLQLEMQDERQRNFE